MIQKTRGGTLISQVNQVSGRIWNRILRDHGMEDLEGARGRVVFALWGNDKVPIKTLCEKTSLDKSTLTGIIHRLVRDGYVEKLSDETDRRNTLIKLTGKEKRFADKMEEVSAPMNEIFYKGFTDDEIILFEEFLARILVNCKSEEQ
ncbi:MAG: MarR family winged helix-turn-helix transcriptional regulator [bacterium]|nr:MarR family winged helix-turn-helix transcriptional regulator [bacterium]